MRSVPCKNMCKKSTTLQEKCYAP